MFLSHLCSQFFRTEHIAPRCLSTATTVKLVSLYLSVAQIVLLHPSRQVPWWAKLRSETVDGRVLEADDGELCYVCGKALDVFCTQDRDDLIHKYTVDDGGWRTKLNLVRSGIQACGDPPKQALEQEVTTTRDISVKVSITAALVSQQVFETHFEVTIAQVKGISLVSLPGPEGIDVAGVLMSLTDFPSDLPHYRVELSSTTARQLKDFLVRPEHVVWHEQCKNKFASTCADSVKSRPGALKAPAIMTLGSYVVTRAAARAARKAQSQTADAHDFKQEAGFAKVSRVSGAAEEEIQQPKKKAAAKRTPGTGGSATSRGGGLKRLGRVSNLTPQSKAPRMHILGLTGTNCSSAASMRSIGSIGGGGASGASSVMMIDGASPLKAAAAPILETCSLAAPAEAKLKSGEPLTFQESLLLELIHDNMGREFRPLATALNKLPAAGEEFQRADLQGKISAVDAARALQLWKLGTAERKEIQKNTKYLAMFDIQLPPAHMAAICTKEACASLADGDVTRWLSIVAPLNWTGSNGSAWLPDRPTFEACLPIHTTTCEKEVHDVLGSWLDALFGNPFMRALNLAGDPKTMDTKPMVSMLKKLLDRLGGVEPPACYKDSVESALTLARGLLALTCPIPTVCQSSFDDVKFVCPSDDQPNPAATIKVPRLGRVITNQLNTPIWKQRSEEYMATYGAQVIHGKVMLPLIANLEEVLQHVGSEADQNGDFDSLKMKCVETFCEHAKEWERQLRSGATDRVEELIVELARESFKEHATGPGGTNSIECFLDLKKVLEHCPSAAGVTLLADVLGKLTAWQLDNTGESVVSAARAFVIGEGGLPERRAQLDMLMASLKQTQATAIPPKCIQPLAEAAACMISKIKPQDCQMDSLGNFWAFASEVGNFKAWSSFMQSLHKIPTSERRWRKLQGEAFFVDRAQVAKQLQTSQSVLVALIADYSTVANSVKMPPAGADDALKRFMSEALAWANSLHIFREVAEHISGLLLCKLAGIFDKTRQIAGGAERGQTWHFKLEDGGDILKHAQTARLTEVGQQIEASAAELRQVRFREGAGVSGELHTAAGRDSFGVSSRI